MTTTARLRRSPIARSALLTVMVCSLSGAALAEERGSQPLPRPKPVVDAEAAREGPGETARPDAAAENRPPDTTGRDEPDASPIDEQALARCEGALEAMGVVFERIAPIKGEGGCGVPAPYSVGALGGGVTLEPDSALDCRAALSLARWVQTVVVPAAEALGPDVRLTGLSHASTYVCRRRNHQSGARLSEHATGRAIDIARFSFTGHEDIAVAPRKGRGNLEEAFQATVRAGGCLYFTTVLGPGSDGFHESHLHLDIAERRRGFRLCR